MKKEELKADLEALREYCKQTYGITDAGLDNEIKNRGNCKRFFCFKLKYKCPHVFKTQPCGKIFIRTRNKSQYSEDSLKKLIRGELTISPHGKSAICPQCGGSCHPCAFQIAGSPGWESLKIRKPINSLGSGWTLDRDRL